MKFFIKDRHLDENGYFIFSDGCLNKKQSNAANVLYSYIDDDYKILKRQNVYHNNSFFVELCALNNALDMATKIINKKTYILVDSAEVIHYIKGNITKKRKNSSTIILSEIQNKINNLNNIEIISVDREMVEPADVLGKI